MRMLDVTKTIIMGLRVIGRRWKGGTEGEEVGGDGSSVDVYVHASLYLISAISNNFFICLFAHILSPCKYLLLLCRYKNIFPSKYPGL
jgi:hypothetical protein